MKLVLMPSKYCDRDAVSAKIDRCRSTLHYTLIDPYTSIHYTYIPLYPYTIYPLHYITLHSASDIRISS